MAKSSPEKLAAALRANLKRRKQAAVPEPTANSSQKAKEPAPQSPKKSA